MNEGESLLRAILDDPAADDRRLVYADWLEDGGQAERAALARLPKITLCRETECWVPEIDAGFPCPCRDEAAALLDALPLPWRRGDLATLRLGFVEAVCCPLQAWLDHGAAVMLAHPVRRVEVTDRKPDGPFGGGLGRIVGYGWAVEGGGSNSCFLPADVFSLLPPSTAQTHQPWKNWRWYTSAQEAIDSLSHSLLEVAKRG